MFEGLISLTPTSGQNISRPTVSCNGTILQVTSAVEVNTGVEGIVLLWFINDNINTNENVSQFVCIYPSLMGINNFMRNQPLFHVHCAHVCLTTLQSAKHLLGFEDSWINAMKVASAEDWFRQ